MLIYNGKKIIPASLVTISREANKTEDGESIGVGYLITLRGKLVAHKGSPDSTGTFWTASGYPADEVIAEDSKLASLLTKQQALAQLFADEGKVLEIAPWDNSTPLTCNPTLRSINFPEGLWVDVCDYEIALEAAKIYGLAEDGGDAPYLSRVSEEWSMELQDENTNVWRLTHSVSATGKRFYDEAGSLTQAAWENARDWVTGRLGINTARMIGADVLDNDTLQAFNYVRSQQVNEKGGTFTVTENWTCFAPGAEPPAIEEYTVEMRANEQGEQFVRVDGSVRGLEQRNNTTHALTTTRYTNALSKWNDYVSGNVYARAGSYSGLTLRTSPVSRQIGYNEVGGTITYSYEYTTKPLSNFGAIEEETTVTTYAASPVVAKIPVPGRLAGPILQDTGTYTEKRRTIQIDLQLLAVPESGIFPAEPDTSLYALNFYPSVGTYTQLFVEQDVTSWSYRKGRYSRQISLTYQ